MIYLDNAATTPLDPEVIETMYKFMKECYGNPSSKYYEQAELAKKHLKKSRQKVASLLNCEADEIIFNGGATEGNNFIIKGIADAHKHEGKHIITSKIEHKSVLNACKYLETQGFEVTYLDVNPLGRVEIETLKEALRDDTILVSIMWGNNEIGTLNDIDSLSELCNEKAILFHTDATQVVGKINVDLSKTKVDFLTCSAHKLYGPKGIGACFIRNDEYGLKPEITPLLHGGSQEDGLRAGTHAMHNIIGFAKACEIAQDTMNEYISRIVQLEKELKDQLVNSIPEITFNGDQENKIPGIINFSIPGVNNEYLVKMVSDEIAVSTGSACALGEPSHVISSLGINQQDYYRISISKCNSTLELITQIFSNIIDAFN